MSCPYFIDGRLCRCTAVRGALIPSHHERERFCRTNQADRCPTYQTRQTLAAPLSEELYWSLWMDGPRTACTLPSLPVFPS